jgi:hypothetical protein
MSGSEALATVRRLFAAVARRDPEEYFAAYHPDILINEAPSLPYGGVYKGLEGVLRHAERFEQPGIATSPRADVSLNQSSLPSAIASSCCGVFAPWAPTETASTCQPSVSTGCKTARSLNHRCIILIRRRSYISLLERAQSRRIRERLAR